MYKMGTHCGLAGTRARCRHTIRGVQLSTVCHVSAAVLQEPPASRMALPNHQMPSLAVNAPVPAALHPVGEINALQHSSTSTSSSSHIV
jgi:hypothetical protein